MTRPGGRLLRLARLAMVVLVTANGSVGKGVVTVAAASCSPDYQCASVTFHLSGNGSGSVSTNPDPPYEGCSLQDGVVTGCLRRNFYWTSGDPYLDIDLAFAPTANSYACLQPQGLPEFCGGAGTPLKAGISVYDGEALDLYATFNLAKSLRMTLNPSGTGAGRVTSTPAGIDCGYASDTQSGTCAHTWYFTGDFPYQLKFVPSPTSYFCAAWVAAGSCPGVGKTFTFNYTQSFDESVGFAAVFNRGTKVTAAVQGHGTVTSGGGEISCPSKCMAYYKPDIVVGLLAKPASGYAFTGWAGACSGETAACNLAVNATDLSTTAIFAKLATPPPSKAPVTTPSSAPQPTAQPSAPTGSPAASADETAGPSPAAPSSSPGEIAAGGTAPPTGDPGTAGGPTTPAGQGPALLPAVIAFLIVALVIALLGGYVLGRRRSAAPPSSDTDQ